MIKETWEIDDVTITAKGYFTIFKNLEDEDIMISIFSKTEHEAWTKLEASLKSQLTTKQILEKLHDHERKTSTMKELSEKIWDAFEIITKEAIGENLSGSDYLVINAVLYSFLEGIMNE